MDMDYYLVQQILPHLKVITLRFYCPLNLVHLKKFISLMAGQINVYKYNYQDNSREDLTKTLGVDEFNIFDYNFENFRQNLFLYTSHYSSPKYFKIYTFNSDFNNTNAPNIFFMCYHLHKLKSVEHMSGSLFYSDIFIHNKINSYGFEYEKFIGLKYESLGYSVEYNGIKKGFNDGGIDLIAIKTDKIVLVQCKNWSLSNNYKITQKDLRAFVGDCYLYIKNLDLNNRKLSFHFIASHSDILTKSSEIFLHNNQFIKFKNIPFEN